jgi:steroid 5-alpha reductase family enzyme
MTPASVLIGGWVLLAGVFAALWSVQVRTRDASLVDVGWAAGLGALALACAALLPGAPARRALVAAMAAIWSLRLASHLYLDRVRGKPEDGRYAALRSAWGATADRNFFFFFQAQALLDVALALPFAALCAKTGPLGAADAAGAAVWLVAVAGEASADRSLAAFRARPNSRGRVCREGLWRFSRHPNYFFEWTHWLAYAVMAPADWRVWLSPALMLYFLLRVTGIPATEAQALKTRGDAYRDYQKTASAFVPWFPRRVSA